MSMVKKRAGWLSALFLGEMLTATAMGYFEKEIERAVVLALFVPLIISSGGNSGSQASTLVIRAMALGEVRLRDWWRVVRREFSAGLGARLHPPRDRPRAHPRLASGLRRLRRALSRWSRRRSPLSLVGVVTFGTLAGSMLPFVLRRLGFDPASASAPFVATLVDVTGLVIYFTVASVIFPRHAAVATDELADRVACVAVSADGCDVRRTRADARAWSRRQWVAVPGDRRQWRAGGARRGGGRGVPSARARGIEMAIAEQHRHARRHDQRGDDLGGTPALPAAARGEARPRTGAVIAKNAAFCRAERAERQDVEHDADASGTAPTASWPPMVRAAGSR